MPQTTVPAVLTALTAMFTAVAPDGVPVSLGPIPGGDIPAKYICVGWASDDLPSVVGQGVLASLGNYGQQAAEQYAVWCVVSTSGGDELAAVRMVEVSDIYTTLLATLRANRTLDGALTPPSFADVGQFQWQIEEGGAVVTLYFQVTIDIRWV